MHTPRFAYGLWSIAFFAAVAAAVAWQGWASWPQFPLTVSLAAFEALHAAKQTVLALAGGFAAVVDALADALAALTAGLS